MTELRLPHLLGPREETKNFVAASELPALIEGDCVVLADDLATGSSSAADELVNQVIIVRNASRMILVSAPRKFEQRVRDAANDRHLSDRVVYQHAAGLESRI